MRYIDPDGKHWLDWVQGGLDVAGLVPGVGELADGTNGLISLYRGNKVEAAYSFGAMIPIAGWLSTGGKVAAKYGDEVVAAGKTIIKAENMSEFFKMDFGKTIKNYLNKSKIMYNGQSIYEVTSNINDYLKKGYGIYLDSLHKDHFEIIDKKGKVIYVLNLDGTLNIDKTKKAIGRTVEGWR